MTSGTDARLVAALDALVAADPHEAWHQATKPVLQALARTTLDLAPGGAGVGSGGDLSASLDAFDALKRWLERHRRALVVRAAETAIANAIVKRAEAAVDWVKADLDRDDHPDLRRIGMEVVKIELFQWLLEHFRREKEIEQLQFLCGRVGRLTIRRVTRIVEAAVARKGLDAQLDMVLTLAQIDELIVLAGKVLSIDAEEQRAHPNLMAERVGLEVARGFITALRNFAPMLVAEVEDRLAKGTADQAQLLAWTRKIELVWRFAEALDHGSVEASISEFRGWLHRSLSDLERRLRAS